MKKLLYGICFLVGISLFISLTQVSCQKSSAQLHSSPQANLILLQKHNQKQISLYPTATDTVRATLNDVDYYLMNMDGSQLRKVPLTLPPGYYSSGSGALSPDGKTLVFTIYKPSAELNAYNYYVDYSKTAVYSCRVDGTEMKKLMEGPYSVQDVR